MQKKKLFSISEGSKGAFVFVIQKAFKVELLLLESGDGHALWNIAYAEIEALSNDTNMLLADLKG